ncbi:UNVERIFIED_CONTAM: hypothetical protein FKN15_017859 [Acipenser sinensis]
MNFKDLIEKINRNTAAQVEQNKTWRVELGLPEPEPTELDLLLQKWEKELPLPEPRGEELPRAGVGKRSQAVSCTRGAGAESRAQRGGAAASRAQRGGAADSRAQRGGAAASGAQREAAASGAQRGGAEKHTSTTAPTSTPPKQSGADGYGPLPRARGHPAGMHGPPSTRPYAQVAALPGTTGCTVPSSAPPGS